MNGQLIDHCGVCEAVMEKAHRVHAGVRYCSSCYARSFKRLACGGCGMIGRLLASSSDPRCRTCISLQPCIRCRRTGRPVGKLTPQGPACNACYTYFIDARPCELCARPSRLLRSFRAGGAEKMACEKCRRADQHSCACCGKHRSCTQSLDGRWQCKRCSELGQIACPVCSKSMAAGHGARCPDCYWRQRCEQAAKQLVELLHARRVRESFLGFVAWQIEQGAPQRAALKLAKHAEFFIALDAAGNQAWTQEFLLRHFGPAKLRRFELPVRWLTASTGVQITPALKSEAVELRRVQQLLDELPERSSARAILDAFAAALDLRRSAGKLTDRSMRLALLPAAAVLTQQIAAGGDGMPTQRMLDRYLRDRPGQRASITAFVNFLNSTHDAQLTLPTKPAAQAASRKALERQIARLITEPADQQQINKSWVVLGLRYFHRLTAAQAKAISALAIRTTEQGAVVLSYQGQTYWLPQTPTAGSSN